MCQLYIAGFLDGALLTDSAIIDSLATSQSDFFERAYRTRLGAGRAPPPPTLLAEFCLPANLPVAPSFAEAP